MMPKTLGELLTKVSQTSGLDRIVAVAVYAGAVIEALDKARKESGARQFDLGSLTETESAVLAQILFFGRECWRNEESLSNWCRFIAQHPEVIEVPGFAEELGHLLKDWVKENPDTMRQAAATLNPRHPPEVTLSILWLGDDVPLHTIPPKHRFWQSLNVSDKGQWDASPGDEQLRRMLGLRSRGRLLDLASIALRLFCAASERGSERSISDERTVPIRAAPDDPRWRGWRHYEMDETTGEAHIELIDHNAERFVHNLEEREAATEKLDRLAAQVILTSGERIVYEGLREGKEGVTLSLYAQERGLVAASIPVLTSRLNKKLRAANAFLIK